MENYIHEWHEGINRHGSTSGRGRNKLRTYCTFKSEFSAESYCKLILPKKPYVSTM